MALRYPKDQGTEWMHLKTQVKDAFTSANSRVPYSKIGVGVLNVLKSIKVAAGAFMQFTFANNVLGLFLGRHLDGQGNTADGIFMNRTNGTLALWIYSRTSDGYGYTAFYDQSGNAIFSDDGGSQKGIAKPWIPISIANTAEISNPPSIRQATGTTDTVVYSTMAPMQHSYLHMQYYAQVFSAGATVEVKIKDLTQGTTLGAKTSGDGFNDLKVPVGNYDFGEFHQIDITIRRVSGTGNVGLTVFGLHGVQT